MKKVKDGAGLQNWFYKGRESLGLICLSIFIVGAFTGFASPVTDVGGKKDLTCYTANAYDGADLNPAILLDPNDPNYMPKLLATVTSIYLDIVASAPPARLAGLAKEIGTRKPDVAGLEEMWTLQTAPATTNGPGVFTTVFDWLELLTNSLAAEGVHYKVVVVSTEADIIMPMLNGSGALQYGRLTDHEVILVRGDLPPGYLRVSNPQTGRFSVFAQIPAIGLSIYRGWVSVDLLTRGQRLRFICSHIEEEFLPEVQMAQATELLVGPAATKMPVVVVGDFNADPLHRDGVTTYDLFPMDGFGDAWLNTHSSNPQGGLTWGHDASLADPSTPLVYRLDLVLYRGSEFRPVSSEVIDPMLGTSEPPLWPSDHAAVFTRFQLNNP